MHDGMKACANLLLHFFPIRNRLAVRFLVPHGWDESLVHRASCLFVFAFLLAIFPLQSFGYVVRDFSCYCTNFRSLLFPSV